MDGVTFGVALPGAGREGPWHAFMVAAEWCASHNVVMAGFSFEEFG